VRYLIQFFANLFSPGTPSPTTVIPETKRVPVAHHHPITAPALLHVTRRLEQVGHLLLTPTPEAIRDATLLLEDAILVLRRDGSGGRDVHSDFPAQVEELERTMERTRRLIEGALRVQWVRLRSIRSVTQGYAPGGKQSKWLPSSPTVDFQG